MANKKKTKPVNKSSGRPVPTVLSINICDAVIRDEMTKKVTLVGLFNTIHANSFPAVHPLLHVYVALTNGHGKYTTEVRFSTIEDNKPIVGMEGELEFDNPLQVSELNLHWQNLRFEKEGPYVVEVRCNGQLVGDRKFNVIGPKQFTPPTSGTEAR